MENRTINIIKNRVSCRNYNSKKVELSKLNKILECGKFAPSARNQQVIKILALRSKRNVEKLRKLSIKELNRDCYYGANTLVLVYGPSDNKFTIQDSSCTLENIFIAASALKVDSCWINQTNDLLNTPEGLKLRKSLGIPADAFIVGTAILGYRGVNEINVKERKEDMVSIL